MERAEDLGSLVVIRDSDLTGCSIEEDDTVMWGGPRASKEQWLVMFPPAPEIEPGQGVLTKLRQDGKYRAWGPEFHDAPLYSGDKDIGNLPKDPNIVCGCGSKDFGVCLWEVGYEVYIKVVCSSCGVEVEREYSF